MFGIKKEGFRGLAGAVFLGLWLSSCQGEKDFVAKGDQFLAAGKAADAEIQYRNGLQKEPNSGVLQQRLGRSLLAQDKSREALAAYVRAGELDPSNLEIQGELSELLLKTFITSVQKPRALYEQLDKIARQLLQQNPNSFVALRIQGTLALADGRYPEGIEILKRARAQDAKNESVHLALVEGLYANKQGTEAEKEARAYLASNPKASSMYDRLYAILLQEKKFPEALLVLENKRNNLPNASEPLLQMARHYFGVEKNEAKGLEQFQPLLNKPEQYPDGLLRVADFYIQAGRVTEAAQILEKGVARNDKQINDIRKLLAQCYQQLNQFDKGLAQLEAVNKTDPKDESVRVAQAILLLGQPGKESVEKALAILEELRKAESKDSRVDFNRGRALFALGRTGEAVQAMQDAIRKQRSNLDARFALIAFSLSQNKASDALREIDQVESIVPGLAKTSIYRLQALRALQRMDEAANLLRQAQRNFPNNDELTLEEGLLMLATRRGPEATASLRKLYQKGGRSPVVISSLVQALKLTKQDAQARALLDTELSEQPNNVDLLALRAQLLSEEGQNDKAIELYEKLGKVEAPMAPIWVNLGALYSKTGQHEKAFASYAKATTLLSDPNVGYSGWVDASIRAANGGEVKKACGEWMKNSKGNWIALNNCAFGLAATNTDLTQAESYANQASQLQPQQPNLRDTLGFIYIQQGKHAEAIRLYQSLCQQQPNNPSFRYHWGLASKKQGSTREAREQFEMALRQKPSPSLEKEIRQALANL